jgi:uncharacterized protein
MPRLLIAFGLALVLVAPSRAAETGLADPQPTIDHPRRIVMTMSEADPKRIDAVLNNVGNIQKFYGADQVRIALVVYGPAIEAVLKDESKVKPRIEGLVAINVEVEACNNTLTAYHKTPADLIEGVKLVPSGLPEVVERQLRGWIYVRP